MAYSFRNPSDGIIKHYLETSKIIAVVGLSDREETTSHRVSKEMQERGYRIIPVNPRAAGGQILGETVYASLQEIPFPVDIVDVYRRSEFLPDVARDFIETDAKIFWAQLELENQEAEEILRGAGREDIVMNRCIKREAGVFFLLLFSFMAWMACKMARPLFDLLDLIIKGNLAVDKVRHGVKADDIAREVIQEVPTNQG